MTNYVDVLSYKNIGGYICPDPFDYSTIEFIIGVKPNQSEIDQYVTEYKIYQCKQESKKRIAEFDWINDNETTPVLLNKEDFYAYRSALRELILNPVENPVFPPIPEEVWDAS